MLSETNLSFLYIFIYIGKILLTLVIKRYNEKIKLFQIF